MKLANSLKPRHWPQDKVTSDLPPKVSAYCRYSLNFSMIVIALETLRGSNAATGRIYTIPSYSQVYCDPIQITYW